jgi:hypothetical protein
VPPGSLVTDGRSAAVRGLVAAQAAAAGQRISVVDVCTVAVGLAQVTGAWVTAASGRGPDFLICVAGPASERLAELHLTLGQGPCHDVLASAAPVLAADLGEVEASRRWPAFTPEAFRLGAGAVFAFPLAIGVIRAGTMGLYRASPGPLPAATFGDSLGHVAGDILARRLRLPQDPAREQ